MVCEEKSVVLLRILSVSDLKTSAGWQPGESDNVNLRDGTGNMDVGCWDVGLRSQTTM